MFPLCDWPRRDLSACQHFFPTDLAVLPSGDFPHANRSHDRQIGFEAPFHQPFDFLYCAPFQHMFEPAIAAFERPWLWRKQEERPQRNLSANAALRMGMPPAKRFSGDRKSVV